MLFDEFPGHRVEFNNAFNLIAPERDTVHDIILIRRGEFKRIAAHSKITRAQFKIVSLVVAFDQLA